MSSTPPVSPSSPDEPTSGSRPGFSYGGGTDISRLPIPGNSEAVVWLLVVILVAIITLASDRVDAPQFVIATTALTFAYLISRGIAKASRVLEH